MLLLFFIVTLILSILYHIFYDIIILGYKKHLKLITPKITFISLKIILIAIFFKLLSITVNIFGYQDDFLKTMIVLSLTIFINLILFSLIDIDYSKYIKKLHNLKKK